MAALPAGGIVMARNMHQKIICRRQILTPASAGQQQESWQEIAIVWADVTALSGDMKVEAGQKFMATGYKIRTRYQDQLRATRTVLWQGQTYRVVSLFDPDNRKRILEMRLVEGRP